jgi:hypothetical protein
MDNESERISKEVVVVLIFAWKDLGISRKPLVSMSVIPAVI